MYDKDFNPMSILFSFFSILSVLSIGLFFFFKIPQLQEKEVEPTYALEKIEDISLKGWLARDPLTDVLYLCYSIGGYTVMLNADGTPVTYDQYIAVYGESDED